MSNGNALLHGLHNPAGLQPCMIQHMGLLQHGKIDQASDGMNVAFGLKFF